MTLDTGIERIYHRALEKNTEYSFLIKPLLTMFVIYYIGIMALIRANCYFIDDLGRALRGYTQWETFSRYISVFLSYVIHADTYLADVSPLTQMIAVFFLSLASVIALYVIREKKQFTIVSLLAAVPIGLSPYFLKCLQYKYDSPYMALSVLVSIFPLLFHKQYTKKKYIIYSILGTMCMCMTYQASSGIYPMFVAALCVKKWIDGEKITKVGHFAAVSAMCYFVGLCIFRKGIMSQVVNYVDIAMPPFGELIPTAVKHYTTFLQRWISDFKDEWLLLVAAMSVSTIFILLKRTKQNKVITFFLLVVAMPVLFFLSFGAYAFLVKPNFSARSVYGIGVFIAVLGIFITDSHKNYCSKFLCVCLSWMFFSYALMFGNAMFLQSQYADYRMEAVISELMTLDVFDTETEKSVRITGSIGFAPAIKNMPQDYGMLDNLMTEGFKSSDSYWGGYKFINYYGLENMKITSSDEGISEELPLLADNVLHTIRGNDSVIWIDLH